MAVTVWESWESRAGDFSYESTGLQRKLFAKGSEDFTVVRTAVELFIGIPTSPLFGAFDVGGGAYVPFKSYSLDPKKIIGVDAEAIWECKVVYATEADNKKEGGGATVQFETGGGTTHITQAKFGGSRRYPDWAPDHVGVIGVNGQSVDGCDITIPIFTFSEQYTLSAGLITNAYVKTLANMTGTVNNGSFRSFAVGEVLFLGANGSKQGPSWQITYKFSASPNAYGLTIGGVSGIDKPGWDYLWVRYADITNGGFVVKVPQAVYVDRVYDYRDFSTLGIGTG